MDAVTGIVARVGPGSCIGVAFMLLVAGAAHAVEVPALRQGVWEFERTAGTSKFVAKECIDPSLELRSQDKALEKIGCKLSPVTQSGSSYTSTAQCQVKLPGGVVSWTTTSAITVESENAYRLETHTVRDGRASDDVTTARRVGDCAN